MRRRLWTFLTALLLAVVIGDFVAWHFAVQRMRTGLADWVAASKTNGWSVSAATPAAGGWPLAATLTLTDFAVQGGASDIPGGLAWRAHRVVLRLDLLHPLVLQIEAGNPQRLRFADAPEISYTAGQLHLLVPLQADPSAQALDLHGEALHASVPVTGGDDALTIDRLDVDAMLHPAAPQGQAAVSVALKADGIGLPSRPAWPLGPRIDSVVLDAVLNGPLPAAAGLTDGATKWRDEGGSLAI